MRYNPETPSVINFNVHLLLIPVLLCFVGCASITPEAKSVMVHSQISTLLDDCERIGNVTADVSAFLDETTALQQAENDARQKAYEMGADTIAVVNTDIMMTEVSVQAIAFKCNK